MAFEVFSSQISYEFEKELITLKEDIDSSKNTEEILEFLVRILTADNISSFFIPSQLSMMTDKVLYTRGLLDFLFNVLDRASVRTFSNSSKEIMEIITRIAKNTTMSRTSPVNHELSLLPKNILESYYVDLPDVNFEEYIINLLVNNVWLIPIYLIMLNSDISNIITEDQ